LIFTRAGVEVFAVEKMDPGAVSLRY